MTKGLPIATRDELTGFDVFDQPTAGGSTRRWGIVMHLAPTTTGAGTVHFWTIDGQKYQDEYAMRRTISRIEAALGR